MLYFKRAYGGGHIALYRSIDFYIRAHLSTMGAHYMDGGILYANFYGRFFFRVGVHTFEIRM